MSGGLLLTRRHFLWLGSSCVAACSGGNLRLEATDSIDLNGFMRISRALTEVDGLSDAVGRLFLTSILANAADARTLSELWVAGAFGGPRPPRSVADLQSRGVYDAPELARLADAITHRWYSGIDVTATGERRVATYDNALAWRVLDYAGGGPSACGGAFGHWGSKPLGA